MFTLAIIVSAAIASLIVIPRTPFTQATCGTNLDLFTQKTPYDGKGQNQPSDMFGPEETVMLYANASLEGMPAIGTLVTFEIMEPVRDQKEVKFYQTAQTNASGIAQTSFTLQVINQTDVFGTWNVVATAELGGNLYSDTLAFQVDYLVELISVKTLDGMLSERTSFGIDGYVGVEIVLRDNARYKKDANIGIVIFDELNVPVSSTQITNFTVPPNGRTWYIFSKLYLPKFAVPGQATISVVAIRPDNASYCPSISTTFMITISNPVLLDFLDASVFLGYLPDRVEPSETVPVAVTARNEGTLNLSSFTVSVYINGSLLDSESTTVLNPYDSQTFNSNWDTSGLPEGNYTITATIPTFLNEADLSDNNYTSVVELKSAPVVMKEPVTLDQTGLDASASGIVVTVNGIPLAFAQLPYTIMADCGSMISYSYSNVPSSNQGQRFVFVGVTGLPSPATVTGPVSVTGNYKTQYQITFNQAGVDSTFSGTIVTIDGTGYNYAALPISFWWDSRSSHTFSFASPLILGTGAQCLWSSTTGLSTLQSGSITVSGAGSVTGNYKTQYYLSVISSYGAPGGQGWYDSGAIAYATSNTGTVDHGNGTRHVFMNWSGDASGTNYASSDPITMNREKTTVANWKTQYSVTLTQTGLDASATGTVVTINGSPLTFMQLPYVLWVDSGSMVSYTYSNVSSSNAGQQFTLVNVTGLPSPATVTGPVSVTGNYKIRCQITFNQTGVGSDFTGTIVTIDGTGYNYAALPISFWWDSRSSHTFSFASPLIVNAGEIHWVSTSGLATTQNGTLTVTGSGSVTGNYMIQSRCQITFDQSGISADYTGTVVIIDGVNYVLSQLPVSFVWDAGSTHTFAYESPLVITLNIKQYGWTSTTGLSLSQSSSITATTSGSITGNYRTQYYLTLATSPSGVTSPMGAGWHDAGTYASISTDHYVGTVSGSSRYSFKNWATIYMSEIVDPSAVSTTVRMDEAKTVIADYVTQYKITFDQTGVGSDFTGTVVTIDGTNYGVRDVNALPLSFWWDNGSSHSFSFASQLIVSSKQYAWISTSGLSPLQSGTLTVTASGSIVGNYAVQSTITFDQVGVGSDFTGTVAMIDNISYGVDALPVSFNWSVGSVHTFAFQSPLVLSENAKQYVWRNTTGLSSAQNGSLTVSSAGRVTGNYTSSTFAPVLPSWGIVVPFLVGLAVLVALAVLMLLLIYWFRRRKRKTTRAPRYVIVVHPHI